MLLPYELEDSKFLIVGLRIIAPRRRATIDCLGIAVADSNVNRGLIRCGYNSRSESGYRKGYRQLGWTPGQRWAIFPDHHQYIHDLCRGVHRRAAFCSPGLFTQNCRYGTKGVVQGGILWAVGALVASWASRAEAAG
jgi:hypothetical protein